jgi:broad specificity phosphatase PhoE
MRLLVVRRESMHEPEHGHLTQAGVSLARRIGTQTSRPDLVVTSPATSAYETAIAMGFAVAEQHTEFGPMEAALRAGCGWPQPFAATANVVQGDEALGAFARRQVCRWREVVEQVPESGAALIITHGGIVEVGAIAALPKADHATWGDALAYGESVRLAFEDGAFREIEVLRVLGHERVVEV